MPLKNGLLLPNLLNRVFKFVYLQRDRLHGIVDGFNFRSGTIIVVNLGVSDVNELFRSAVREIIIIVLNVLLRGCV